MQEDRKLKLTLGCGRCVSVRINRMSYHSLRNFGFTSKLLLKCVCILFFCVKVFGIV